MEQHLNGLTNKLESYVNQFNRQDAEIYSQLIPNDQAFGYLLENIPLLDCPEKELEEIYYFRWWTFRKHWKQTEKGHIVTEFLPDVPWSGAYNSINCATCLHIREGRWLRDTQQWLPEYMDFWMNCYGNTDAYSAWYPAAMWEYCTLRGDFEYGLRNLPKMIAFYQRREQEHRHPSGLYWSVDNWDGMEYGISGVGLRPTINSYVWADARAIGNFATMAGDAATAQLYYDKAAELKAKVEKHLWADGFYKTIPAETHQAEALWERPPERNVRELIGYVPWYFGLPEPGKTDAFQLLNRQDVFAAPAGLTTADQGHPRFMEEFDHECLWNGPVWPFATSQTLVAAANMLRSEGSSSFTPEDYYTLLLQYARSHHRTDEQGRILPWIDENMHPYTGRWLARDILESWGWPVEEKGGFERGKDYNHSLFCDLVLDGLLGIGPGPDGEIRVNPLIPEDWNYFWVENVMVQGNRYRIVYDKDGSHYGTAPGLHCYKLT